MNPVEKYCIQICVILEPFNIMFCLKKNPDGKKFHFKKARICSLFGG